MSHVHRLSASHRPGIRRLRHGHQRERGHCRHNRKHRQDAGSRHHRLLPGLTRQKRFISDTAVPARQPAHSPKYLATEPAMQYNGPRRASRRTRPAGQALLAGNRASLTLPSGSAPTYEPEPPFGSAAGVGALRVQARRKMRHAGVQAVERHWPGTRDGFAALCRLTGLTTDVASCPAGQPRAGETEVPGIGPAGREPVRQRARRCPRRRAGYQASSISSSVPSSSISNSTFRLT